MDADGAPMPALRRSALAIALVATIASACSSPAPDRPGPPTGAEPATSDATGVSGEARPSPRPTSDPVSDDPADETASRTRFAGRISAIPASIQADLRGSTWHPGCPVPLDDLRFLQFNYVGFDGEIKRGPMIVNASVAEDVLWVFEQLFEAAFPLKRVGLAREFHERRYEEQPNSRRSVTASFNCRVVITPAGPGTEFSQHSYGLAVDVNPLQNPFVREDGWVRNRFARPYVDRSGEAPGMIHDGDLVVQAFAAIGWAWGGRWSGGKDYMHFSLLGR